ncbi:MAG TPA: M20 family metallopeptidase [Anaerolineales bacterium]|nr:M20 family metallopeptidase [Anaerolineales bacterium]
MFQPSNLSPDLSGKLQKLQEICAIESPSNHANAIQAVCETVENWLMPFQPVIQHFDHPGYGRNVVFTFPAQQAHVTGGIFLLCHVDTVHPVGTLQKNPIRIVGEKFYGPGSYDMKASVVQAWWAIELLLAKQSSLAYPIHLMLNCDEEIDSPTSQALIETYGKNADLTLCLEPATPDGAIKTQRKGVGTYVLRVQGRAAHAGNEHTTGVNAIAEMAQQILRVQNFTRYEQGTTVSAGLIQGGTAVNTVPEFCTMEVDVRIEDEEERKRLEREFHALQVVDARASLTVEGGVSRPPMPRTPAIAQAYEKMKQIAAQTGFALREASVGGGSDAAYVAQLGKPVLCGMGPGGNGAHTLQEYTDIPSFLERTALLANALLHWYD